MELQAGAGGAAPCVAEVVAGDGGGPFFERLFPGVGGFERHGLLVAVVVE